MHPLLNAVSLFPGELVYCWFMMDYIKAPHRSLCAVALALLDVGCCVVFSQGALLHFILIVALGIGFILLFSTIPRFYGLVYFIIRLFIALISETPLSLIMMAIFPELAITDLATRLPVWIVVGIRLVLIPLAFLFCFFIRWICNRIFHTSASQVIGQYIPFFVMEFVILFAVYMNCSLLYRESTWSGILLIILLVCFTVLDLLLMRTIETLKKAHQTELQLTQTQQLLRTMSQSYDQFMENTSIIRQLRHDMDNQLRTISLLLEHQEYDKASRQLDSYRSSVSQTGKLVYTGNHIIDAVINSKAALMDGDGIAFSCSGSLPDTVGVDPAALCSLTSNLLDNAMNACILVGSTIPKEICFAVGVRNDRLVIRCENSCPPDTRLPDSKKAAPSQEHGWGLQIIQRISEMYGGDTVFELTNQRFIATVQCSLSSEAK